MAKGKLSEYSAKRRFASTPEPAPSLAAEARSGPLLFVVQQHAARRLHYDFRLECDGVLKSWAVPKGPSLDPSDKRLAVPTEDHPFDYASFEGIIPPGQYGAGEVIVWDCGVYSPDEQEPWIEDREAAEAQVRLGLENGKLGITLRGQKLKGSFALVRTSDRKSWLLLKHKDRFAMGVDVTTRRRSALSGIAVDEMKAMPVSRVDASRLAPGGGARPMPTKLEPMHAEVADAPFNRTGWMWEPKLDGYRILAFVDGQVKLRSRRGLELAKQFPDLAAELAEQGTRMIIDGELVAFAEGGKPSFNALQNRFQLRSARDITAAERSTPVVFYAFDLLYFAGVDLREAPYADRRRYLEQCLLPSPRVQIVHASEDGPALYEAALASGFEGVIGKRKDGKYEAGRRSASWLKVKAIQSDDFVVGGYTKGRGARKALGALLVGTWDGGRLRYASHVGSGFDDGTLAVMRERLEPLRRRSCPFAEKPALNAPTTWVEPKVVVEVKFQDWTEDGSLRAPVFLRLREDVEPKAPKALRKPQAAADAPSTRSTIDDVLRQLDNPKASFTLAVGPDAIRLTHLDRVYWPADPALKQPPLTKRDLLRYLARISPAMLPHLADRPLTMIRMPDGIRGQRFFQKHWAPQHPAFVDTITVYSSHKEESHEALLCQNLSTLLWLAQSGTLEFHVWHSRARPGPDAATMSTDFASSLDTLEDSVLNYPDYVVFDIDPYIYSGREAPGEEPELNNVAFEKGKEVAFRLRELLGQLSLECIVKTSGKTGLHVFVPIRRTLDFEAARSVSETVGRHLMRLHPRDVTLEWSVPKRTGKIFMDYNMNVRGKTLNVAYSPRGAPGAPVSMPLTWDELAKAHPLDFRISNAVDFVAGEGDRWREALERKQGLESMLKRANT
ncbi:MAG TPA: DNA ligase D [Burkholderiales bacterium]|nr:DNA ligase D [Burkholderiales bacterium]